MYKVFYYDVETTGLDTKLCSVHQISGAIEVGGEVKEYFDFRLSPLLTGIERYNDGKQWAKRTFDKQHSDFALSMTGKTLDELIADGESASVVAKSIISIMSKYVDQYDKYDKFFLCGFNNRKFDDNVIRQFFDDVDYNWFGSWFWSNTCDVSVMATEALKNVRPSMESFKLSSVARELGIDVDESRLHDSKYDIELTIEVRKRSLELLSRA